MNHCPQFGKINIIILFCLIFTCILTTINSTSKKYSSDVLYGFGIFTNIIQTVFTLYLLFIDIFKWCKYDCNNECKWYNISPVSNCKNISFVKGYIYIPILLLSSCYTLGFGLTIIKNYDEENIYICIASIIIGIIGLLLIFTDIFCNIGCFCK